MTESTSELEPTPSAPAKGGKGKIIAVVLVIALLIAAIAAWRLLSQPAGPTGPTPIVIKVQALQWATFLDYVRNEIPALFFLGWAPDYADPDDYVVPFLRSGGTFPNRVGYSNATLDALIDAQSSDTNPTTRLATLKQIQLAPFYDVPYIWRNQAVSQVVFRDVVTGYYPNPMTFDGTGNYYYDLNKTTGLDPTFTELTFGEPDSLDPAFDYETSGGTIIQNVAETLIWYNGASASQFKPMLATKVPDSSNITDVSPDGMTWNFTLQPGLTFHSGNLVTCAAVEFSIERVLMINDPDGPAWILDQSLTDYAADDPATTTVDERLVAIQNSVTCPLGGVGLAVQFRLAKQYPAFLATMAFTAASVIDPDPASYTTSSRCATPADLYNTTCDDQLVGTGPFELRVWTPGTQILLDRNTNYWRALAPIAVVDRQKVDDVATRVLRLKAGDADAIDLSPDHAADIRDANGNVLPGIVEYSNPTFVVQFLGLNQNINVTGAPAGDSDVPAGFFADPDVRKAFAYAWNYDGFIQDVLLGYGTVLCGPIPEGMFGYDPTVPCFNQDLAKVRQYLENATDTRPGHTGSYWDNGFTLTLYYNEGNLPREEGARQLKATLEGLNSQRTGTRSGTGSGTRSGSPPISIAIQPLAGAIGLFLAWAPTLGRRTTPRALPSVRVRRSSTAEARSTSSPIGSRRT